MQRFILTLSKLPKLDQKHFIIFSLILFCRARNTTYKNQLGQNLSVKITQQYPIIIPSIKILIRDKNVQNFQIGIIKYWM